MLPTYSLTEYTSPSGATQIYIVRKKKDNLQKISEDRRYIVRQKLLGLTAIILGLIGCVIFPEDSSGTLFVCALGILRLIF